LGVEEEAATTSPRKFRTSKPFESLHSIACSLKGTQRGWIEFSEAANFTERPIQGEAKTKVLLQLF